jgi:hypothetical protein
MPKLTLSAEKDVIEKAKRMAEERGTSVSAMFSQFVNAISEPRLQGLAKVSPKKSDRELYEEAILAKGRR